MFDSDFLKNVLPPEKRAFELGLPWVLIQRVISLPLVITCVFFKVSPNVISFLSILLLLIGSYMILVGNLGIGLIICSLSLIFDCVDGEVARVLGKISILGEKLEYIGANLFFILVIPSVSVWLFLYDDFSVLVIYFCFLSAGIYVLNRGVFNSSYSLPDEKLNFSKRIIFAQLKSNIKIRKESFWGNFIFYLRLNSCTQDGLLFFIMILAGILMPNSVFYLLIIMSLSQLSVGFTVIMINLWNKEFWTN